MQKFLVLYMAPVEGLKEWEKMDEAVRKEEEDKMKAGWDAWMAEHSAMFTGTTAGAGKNKRVTSLGIEDLANDVMLFSIVEGESHEAVAKAFENHPHFGIPNGWIDIMPANSLPGME